MIINKQSWKSRLWILSWTEDNQNESKSYISMHRVQAEKLHFYEEQEERSRSYRIKQVLQILQETDSS